MGGAAGAGPCRSTGDSRIEDTEHLQASRASRWRFLSHCTKRWKHCDRDWRCQRQGYAGSYEGRVPCRTLRSLAHHIESPAEILSAMNQRMLTRSRGGFTTCLVLRVDANEEIIVANAGHIARFCEREKVCNENGLPLGLRRPWSRFGPDFFRGSQVPGSIGS